MATKGIDVSKYQGNIDFSKVSADGVKFIIIRSGYGSSTSQKDTYFDQNYSGAKAAGIPMGSYWYSYASSVAEAEKEAETCLSVINGKSFTYPVFFDIEENSQATLGKTVCTNMALAFCKKIKAAGHKAGVYANKDFFTNYVDGDAIKTAGYYRWVAHYGTTTDYSGSYDMHQYSSTGSVNGISGNVDMDYGFTSFSSSSSDSLGATSIDNSGSTSTSSSNSSSTSGISAGTKLTLSNVKLYASSTAASSAGTKSGTYYAWDNQKLNGRIRITTNASYAGNAGQVTGWVNLSDVSVSGTGSTTSSDNSNSTTYTVVNGDTLSAIALKYGTTVSKIVSANKSKYPSITADYIMVGWKLTI